MSTFQKIQLGLLTIAAAVGVVYLVKSGKGAELASVIIGTAEVATETVVEAAAG